MRNCCLYAHSNGLLKIGSRVSVSGEIAIGNDVLIGPNVVIRVSNYQYKDKNIPINRQGHTGGEIIVEDDAWIGANVVVLPNITVGKGAVAVVCKSTPPYCLAGGVPVKVIKENCRN